MSSKSRPKKTAKAPKTSSAPAKTSKLSTALSVAKAGASMLGIGGGGSAKKGSGRRSKKRSALWYAKQIQRLKLKRKYDKEKMRI